MHRYPNLAPTHHYFNLKILDPFEKTDQTNIVVDECQCRSKGWNDLVNQCWNVLQVLYYSHPYKESSKKADTTFTTLLKPTKIKRL